MAIGLRLDLRQSQQLVMTPQLQQAIKLLQMSNLELTDFVEGEVEKNPLLKLEDGDRAETESPAPQTAGESDTAAAVDTQVQADSDPAQSIEVFDTGSENLHDDSAADSPPSSEPVAPIGSNGSGPGASGSRPSGDGEFALEDRLADRLSLREHLHEQLGQLKKTSLEAIISAHLVDELDGHGYLRTSLEEIAERLGVSMRDVEDALTVVQECDPTGVGARDLGECLRLQLAENGLLTPQMDALTRNLDHLARGEVKPLEKACGIARDEIADLAALLRSLNPRPCSEFDVQDVQTLIPDILLRTTKWGGWHLELNPDTLPRVILDRTYAVEFGGADCDETKSYLAECRNNATWLIKSLDQRARTILTVATEVVRQQERFFAEGVSGLKPLTLKTVADAVGMHESTASRVTANKYIATSRGVFEMKFFFTNAVGGGEGDLAAAAVRHKIKAMVDAEPPDAVLTDDAIVDTLRGEGIDIARRTVAKYRKSLKILSSVERRRQKALH
ncbi:MAG: RNA polymerase factor sigma-54 [Pseudomonadota bacterium]